MKFRQRTRTYLGVALGGAAGSMARYGTAMGMAELLGPAFPWGTLIVNLLGSGFIGFYFTLTEPDGRMLASPPIRQLVLAGFCGGFTTFSMFGLETVLMIERSLWAAAAAYVSGSVVSWLAAVWLGHALALRINRLPWRRR
jgi:CrcB protein